MHAYPSRFHSSSPTQTSQCTPNHGAHAPSPPPSINHRDDLLRSQHHSLARFHTQIHSSNIESKNDHSNPTVTRTRSEKSPPDTTTDHQFSCPSSRSYATTTCFASSHHDSARCVTLAAICPEYMTNSTSNETLLDSNPNITAIIKILWYFSHDL